MHAHRTYRNLMDHGARFRLLAACVIVTFLIVALAGTGFAVVPRAAAQGGDEIKFNEPQIVTLTPGQSLTRTFGVLPGDTVEIRLSRLSEFTYTAVLIDPAQNATPFVVAADGNAVLLIENSPISGAYSLVLQASTGPGDLLIQVNSDSVLPVPLAMGETTVILTTTAIRYELVPPAGLGDTTLTLTALTPTTAPYPTLPAYTLVNATSGETVFIMKAGQLPYMNVTLPAQQSFLLALEPGTDPNAAPLQVRITWNAAATPSGPAQPPQGQSNQGPSGQGTGACQIYFAGAVNIRSGPGTGYEPPIGQAQAGSTYPVTGHDGYYAWYQIGYNGVPGWVSGQIDATQLQGDCSAVGPVSYPPPPGGGNGNGGNGNNAASPTATYTLVPGVTPTYTYTPPPGATQAPTATYTPSYTPTNDVQVAPPDTNYALTVPLDGTVSISEVISFPGGDVEDVVGYNVSGLNNSVALPGGQADLAFQLQCTGTGTEFVNFRIDGQDFSCGQTFTRRVNIDSRTGAIRISANGGSATFVQWTVIGTAPRTN